MSVILLLSSGGVFNPAAPTAPTVDTSSSVAQALVSSSVNISVSTITSAASVVSPNVGINNIVLPSTISTSSSLSSVSLFSVVLAGAPSIYGVVAYGSVVALTDRRYLRPTGDTFSGSWTISPLWSKVDEAAYDDSDFITSEALTYGTTSIAKLALTLV